MRTATRIAAAAAIVIAIGSIVPAPVEASVTEAFAQAICFGASATIGGYTVDVGPIHASVDKIAHAGAFVCIEE